MRRVMHLNGQLLLTIQDLFPTKLMEDNCLVLMRNINSLLNLRRKAYLRNYMCEIILLLLKGPSMYFHIDIVLNLTKVVSNQSKTNHVVSKFIATNYQLSSICSFREWLNIKMDFDALTSSHVNFIVWRFKPPDKDIRQYYHLLNLWTTRCLNS